MLASRKNPLALKIVLAILIITIIITTRLRYSEALVVVKAKAIGNSTTGYESSLSGSDGLNRVTNHTLGFEKIYVISLPERSDKRDALALISSLVGFGLDWIDGIKGESVPDKAVPFGTDRKLNGESYLGSWRGHMNAIRGIVENQISSALLMEDDMDFDVRLKQQLQHFAAGSRYIQQTPPEKEPVSPYGDDWDVLWLGHCGEVFPETLPEHKSQPSTDPAVIGMSRKYIIGNDPTVPPAENVTGFQDFKAFPHTRWVHQSGVPICTFAYAISNRGAHKILYDLSVDHLLGPFDNALANLCRYGKAPDVLDMKCISSTPPLFFHHKAKGYLSGDSDIRVVGEGGQKVREKGTTENISWSARNNVRQMMHGGPYESQYVEETLEGNVTEQASGPW